MELMYNLSDGEIVSARHTFSTYSQTKTIDLGSFQIDEVSDNQILCNNLFTYFNLRNCHNLGKWFVNADTLYERVGWLPVEVEPTNNPTTNNALLVTQFSDLTQLSQDYAALVAELEAYIAGKAQTIPEIRVAIRYFAQVLLVIVRLLGYVLRIPGAY
jgi:hypothetical protein